MASETYTMEYGNASWLDQLTKVTYTDASGNTSSQSLRYGQMGNPTRYFNGYGSWNFTWKFGRQLANATNGSRNISYTYDVDGIRQSKTVNGNTTSYTTLDGKVVREANGNVTTDYFYDNEGKPYKIVVTNNTTSYEGYYVLNQQGDVTAILDTYGNVAVSYDYNAWGRILSESGSSTIQSMYLQSYNHLKYRGYYQDAETGFYYVSSRYYDPVIGRFINADDVSLLTANPTALTDKNLYAYCDNNPVVRRDESGAIWETVFDVISLGASIMEVAANPKDPWAWAGLVGDAIDLIPIVTGAGEAIRGLKVVSKVSDAADKLKFSDELKDASSNIKKIAGKITGYTKHGLEQAMGRNGVGVAPQAILDAVRNPKKILPKIDNRGRYSVQYRGSMATVVLNRDGKIISCWAKSSKYWRIKK